MKEMKYKNRQYTLWLNPTTALTAMLTALTALLSANGPCDPNGLC